MTLATHLFYLHPDPQLVLLLGQLFAVWRHLQNPFQARKNGRRLLREAKS
jgi:hypothetical protein